MVLNMFMCLEIFLVLSLFEDNELLLRYYVLIHIYNKDTRSYHLHLKIIFPVILYNIDCCTEIKQNNISHMAEPNLFHPHTSLDLLGKNWPERFLMH